ncbi:DUF3226 domain-containing protein [Mesorhizobium sp. M0091]|uniref:DUF3226 domain-containing protein n=1 Tax=Mesorhizobium sp. M0091 TaxID=2956875 RepID=UPI00047AA6A4
MTSYLVTKPLKGSLRPHASRLFLAEGLSEVGFIEAYLTSRGVPVEDILLVCFEGIGKLAGGVDTLLKLINDNGQPISRFSHVGVYVDAEADPVGRRQAVANAAQKFGFSAQASQGLLGALTHDENGRRFAFHMAPNNGSSGKIEDMIVAEIDGSNLSGCMNAYEECLAHEQAIALTSKAKSQIYVISRRNSDAAGIGRAFTDGTLKVDHGAYAAFRTSIDSLID